MTFSVQTRTLTEFDVDTWRPLIAGYPYGPYYFLREVSAEQCTRLLAASLCRAVSAAGSLVVGAYADRRPCGLLVIGDLEWESAFFGYRCAKLHGLLARGETARQVKIKSTLLDHALRRLSTNGYRMLHAAVDTKDFSGKWALEDHGFLFSVVAIHWTGHFHDFGPPPPNVVRVRPIADGDRPDLRRVSRESMLYNRFSADAHFARSKVAEMYERMVDACADGALADHVLVAEHDGRAVGFVALQVRREVADVLERPVGNFRYLVRDASAPPGTGPGLVDAGIAWFRDRVRFTESETALQNTGMIRSALRHGFRVQATQTDYFKWFGDGER